MMRILGIEDWDISIGVVGNQLAYDRYGDCHYHTDRKNAVIRILDPEDCSSDPLAPPPDRVLLHELIHCALGQFDDSLSEKELESLVCWVERVVYRLSNGQVQKTRTGKGSRRKRTQKG